MTYYRLPYRYRRAFGYRRTGRAHPAVLIAAAVALASGVGASAAGHHHGRIPDAGRYTPRSWARALLAAGGLPRTPCDVGAMVAWERTEGGHWANQARYNPLNSTMPEPGSSFFWSAGPGSAPIRIYTSWHQGLAATAATLENGRYPSVLAALRAGNDAQAVANAVAASPWGTYPFGASC